MGIRAPSVVVVPAKTTVGQPLCWRQLSMIGLLPDMPPSEIKFQTERTRKFRASALSEEDERTISHIERFGCSVVNVKGTNYGAGWTFTVGVLIPAADPKSSRLDCEEKPRILL